MTGYSYYNLVLSWIFFLFVLIWSVLTLILISKQKSATKSYLGSLKRKKVLVLDLDETLVHSTIKLPENYDYRIRLTREDNTCIDFFGNKRPHVDVFLRMVSRWYEICIFTAGLKTYADPVIEYLDTSRVVSRRYFRESCINYKGNFMKDLSRLNMDLSKTVIIDNSPISYGLCQDNAIPIDHFFDNTNDKSLLKIIPFLECLSKVEDVRSILGLRLRSKTLM